MPSLFNRTRQKLRFATATLESMVGIAGAFYEGWQDGAEPEVSVSKFLRGRDGGVHGLRASALNVRAEQAAFVLTKRFYEGRAAYRYGCIAQAKTDRVIH